MTGEQWASICRADPGDPVHLLGYADWLEENGLSPELRLALRLMARHGWRPGRRTSYLGRAGKRKVPAKYGWCWYREGQSRRDPCRPPQSCELPRGLFVEMAGNVLADHLYHPSWDDAIAALTQGIDRVRKCLEAT